ncbi:DUF6580 family putative transport protein [Leptospira sp. GIMC2001]|uniref:DUF6580 family putative transport protein n=1 Tax=Leptospira sp. GIMC2001 TaxID=1513297 RepID=UPI002349A0DC|nr:DUF6580 family putative transport protein [Leptospira sp. GIMC2001]WCL50084.1 hypothetical protein O4O04_04500 [Leptospira sp. GIMC2001]
MLRSTLFISVALILVAAATRLLPHPANFTPLIAISLFGGAYLANRFLAALIPVGAMFISDLVIGFHDLMIPIYLLMIVTSIVGRQLMNSESATKIGSYSIGSSLVFFVVTNFLVWISSGMYSLDMSGLITCFMMAIPFFQNQVLGDLLYTAFLFGSMILLQRQNLVLAPVTSNH